MRLISDMKKPSVSSVRYEWYYHDGNSRILYVTDRHHILNNGTIIVSRTDVDGIITHANRAFVETSGYSEEELMGKPHYILRHPDVPKAAFKEMWETVRAGKEWHGYLKNLRKDGAYYWVYATVAPIVRNGMLIGCTSVRRKVEERIIDEYETLYRQMCREEIVQMKHEEEEKPGLLAKLFGKKK